VQHLFLEFYHLENDFIYWDQSKAETLMYRRKTW